MKVFEKYEHHGAEVFVMRELKGLHQEFCLCYSCGKFRPDTSENCPIAQRIYELDVELNLVTPVWECGEFRIAPDTDELRGALKELIAFIPEGASPQDYADIFGFSLEDIGEETQVPFLSESFLYAALGKEDARTVRALFRQICEKLGFDFPVLELEAYQLIKEQTWES